VSDKEEKRKKAKKDREKREEREAKGLRLNSEKGRDDLPKPSRGWMIFPTPEVWASAVRDFELTKRPPAGEKDRIFLDVNIGHLYRDTSAADGMDCRRSVGQVAHPRRRELLGKRVLQTERRRYCDSLQLRISGHGTDGT
jgi:hypothetical protein